MKSPSLLSLSRKPSRRALKHAKTNVIKKLFGSWCYGAVGRFTICSWKTFTWIFQVRKDSRSVHIKKDRERDAWCQVFLWMSQATENNIRISVFSVISHKLYSFNFLCQFLINSLFSRQLAPSFFKTKQFLTCSGQRLPEP